ncbi:hypothetical protein GC096_22245 [Paenibacillus sp. LMG 31461]|uniref:SLH domain-containing protein n=1 Tax=Paenibacillus plantarum TaxID=2654975 RepID=A0ABX1XF42_9BACL|nr:S-layer homology domain-containing protein [Paenibacillus plantarum]NOU66771.1 hypothetical protein [Paenibacillus plantarum]
MKKTLSVVLTSAMALSMFSSVAFGKTSADFTDLKDLDAATKAKFDAMISAEIFDGVSDTTFGLKEEMNRAQFAKVAALIMGLEVNKDLKTSSFTDVSVTDPANGYALPYIEALKTASVTDGYAEGQYNPAGKVTKEQLATFLVRVLGKDAEAKALTGTDKTVSGWAQGYVAEALALKVLANNADGTFGGITNATRDLLVTGAYEAKQQYVPAGQVSLTEAKATGVQQVTVTFNKPVDTTKATVALKKGAVEIATTAKFADNKKSVVLTLTDTKVTEGEYTATLSGLDATNVDKSSASFKGENETVQKIDFINTNDTLPRTNSVIVRLKATNQYGEAASANSSSYTVSAGNNNDVLVSLKKDETTGELLLNLRTDIQTGGVDVYQAGTGIIPINIYNNDSHVTASKNFKMGTAPFISKLEIGEVTYSNGKGYISGTGENAMVNVLQYDQYGNLIPYSTNDATAIRFTLEGYEPSLTTPVITDSNNDNIADMKISLSQSVDKDAEYNFSVYNQAGSATGKITLKSNKVANKVELGDATEIIAAGDTAAYLPLTAYDAAGNKLSTDDVISAQNAGRITLSSNATLVLSGEHKGQVLVSSIPTTPKSVLSVTAIIAQPNANSVSTKTITVGDVRVPERMSVSTEAKQKIIGGATSEFKFVVYDQYGKKMTDLKNVDSNGSVTVATTAGVAQYKVVVTKELTGTGVDIVDSTSSIPASRDYTGDDVVDFNDGFTFKAANPTLTASAKFTARIVKTTDNWATEQELSKQVRTIENTTDELAYSVNAVSDLFNAIDSDILADSNYGAGTLTVADQESPVTSKFAKEVKLSATDTAGNSVAVGSTIQAITSSDVSVARAAVDPSTNKAYVIGNNKGKATLNVAYTTSKGVQEMKTLNVNVKDDVIQATKITLENETISRSSTNAFVALNVKVTDNYGVTYEGLDAQKYNYLFGITFSVTHITGTGSVSVDKDGEITYTNGTPTSYELTATTANGQTVSAFVNN